MEEITRAPTGVEDMFDDDTIIERCSEMLSKIRVDSEHYRLLNDYHQGRQLRPRVPVKGVDPQIEDLTYRAITNLIRLAVNVPAQLSFAEGYSRIPEDESSEEVVKDPPEWDVWNRCGFKAQQTTVFKTACRYGSAYVSVEGHETGDEVNIKLLSTRRTIAYFEDPVNDRIPVFALTIRDEGMADLPGTAIYYDRDQIVYLDYRRGEFSNPRPISHSLGICPVVRFVCEIDDEGRTTGIVEPLIPAQDRVNQTTFDLLVTQAFGSFKVRWAAGLSGEPLIDPETGEQRLDADGNPMVKPIKATQDRMLAVDDPSSRFGTFDETPLDGFISALEDSFRSFAVQGSIPPHSLLGSMANLSGETIEAAMGQTNRFVHMLKTSWAESIVQLMKVIRLANGDASEGYTDEIRWRDMSDQSIAVVVDALGKASQMLGIPGEGLWPRVPGVTAYDMRRFRKLSEEQKEQEREGQDDPEASFDREANDSPDTLDTFMNVDESERG